MSNLNFSQIEDRIDECLALKKQLLALDSNIDLILFNTFCENIFEVVDFLQKKIKDNKSCIKTQFDKYVDIAKELGVHEQIQAKLQEKNANDSTSPAQESNASVANPPVQEIKDSNSLPPVQRNNPFATGQDIPVKKVPAGTPLNQALRKKPKPTIEVILSHVKDKSPEIYKFIMESLGNDFDINEVTRDNNSNNKLTIEEQIDQAKKNVHTQNVKATTCPKNVTCLNCCSDMSFMGKTIQDVVNFLKMRLDKLDVHSSNSYFYYCENCGRIHLHVDKETPLSCFPGSSMDLETVFAMNNDVWNLRTLNNIDSEFHRLARIGNNYTYFNYRVTNAAIMVPLSILIKYSIDNNNSIIRSDETTYDNLERRGQCISCNKASDKEKVTSQQYILCLLTPYNSELKAVYFNYMPSRSSEHINDILSPIKNLKYLLTDGYSGYIKFCLKRGIGLARCLVHVRRNLINGMSPEQIAQSILEKNEPLNNLLVKQISEIFVLLSAIYKLEPPENSSIQELQKAREKSKPLLDKIYEILHEIADNEKLKKIESEVFDPATQKVIKIYKYSSPTNCHPIIKGVVYALNAEFGVKLGHSNPVIPLDNNSTERSIRPFAQSRKMSFFRTSEIGARIHCAIYTVFATLSYNNKPLHILYDIMREIRIELHRVFIEHKCKNGGFDPLDLAQKAISSNDSNISNPSSDDFIAMLPNVSLDFWTNIANKLLSLNPDIFPNQKITIKQDFYKYLINWVEMYFKAYQPRRKKESTDQPFEIINPVEGKTPPI